MRVDILRNVLYSVERVNQERILSSKNQSKRTYQTYIKFYIITQTSVLKDDIDVLVNQAEFHNDFSNVLGTVQE